jgi:acylphosphatase
MHTVAMARKRVKVLVSGQVQGVFFRVETAERARKLGLGGYVRNSIGGRVEAEFEGDDHDVDSMVAWCREGPPLARVTDVEVTEIEPKGDTEFRIRH